MCVCGTSRGRGGGNKWPIRFTLFATRLFTFGVYGCLSCKCFQHLSSPCEPITTFPNADVQTQFLYLQIPHSIFYLGLGRTKGDTVRSTCKLTEALCPEKTRSVQIHSPTSSPARAHVPRYCEKDRACAVAGRMTFELFTAMKSYPSLLSFLAAAQLLLLSRSQQFDGESVLSGTLPFSYL